MTSSLRLLISFCFLITCQSQFGQIKIGDNPQSLDKSSILELESTTRTLILSRVSSSEMQIINPLKGALIYNTDVECVFFYDGTQWNNLCENSLIDPVVIIGPAGPQGEQGVPGEPGPQGVPGPPGTGTGEDITITNNNNGTYTITNNEGTFLIDTTTHTGVEGALFFGDTTGIPSFDQTNLYWNNTTKKLGIGTNNPESTLDVNGNITSSRIHNGRGSVSYPGYHFQDNTSTGMFSIIRNILGFSTGGSEAMRIIGNGNVGINVQNPLATLHVGGNLIVDGTVTTSGGTFKTETNTSSLKSIRRLSNPKEALAVTDETLILEESVTQLIFPYTTTEHTGLLFILKNLSSRSISSNIQYKNLNNRDVTTLSKNSTIWLQFDGIEWQQIR